MTLTRRGKGSKEAQQLVTTLRLQSTIDPAIEQAAASVLTILDNDASDATENFSVSICNCCQQLLEEDLKLPSVYFPLHKQLCHVETGEKSVPRSSARQKLN
jgi:hypothetical protein